MALGSSTASGRQEVPINVMKNLFLLILALAVLAGCSGGKSEEPSGFENNKPIPAEDGGAPPTK